MLWQPEECVDMTCQLMINKSAFFNITYIKGTKHV